MIKPKDKEKFQEKVQRYVDGKGKLTPKWLKAPQFTAEVLSGGSDVVINGETCDKLYPFQLTTSDERKFRVLIALRFSCKLGGMSDNTVEVKYIDEWLRQLLIHSEDLRNKCGIRDWSFIKLID